MALDPGIQVTQILQVIGSEEAPPGSGERLFSLVYAELRQLAGSHLRRERANHTLQATEIVHEAYVKLVGGQQVDWQCRGHFFGVAARAMRQILVDHARSRGRDKRGGGEAPVTLHDDLYLVLPESEYSPEDLMALNDALNDLEVQSPRQARIVELRCFANLKVDEVAQALGVSRRTVEGDWTHARAWLKRRMSGRECR